MNSFDKIPLNNFLIFKSPASSTDPNPYAEAWMVGEVTLHAAMLKIIDLLEVDSTKLLAKSKLPDIVKEGKTYLLGEIALIGWNISRAIYNAEKETDGSYCIGKVEGPDS